MLGNPPKREWTPKKATPNDIKPKKSGWNISHYGFMERTVYFPTLSVFLIVNESRYTMQDHTWIPWAYNCQLHFGRTAPFQRLLSAFGVFCLPSFSKKHNKTGSLFLVPFSYHLLESSWIGTISDSSRHRQALTKSRGIGKSWSVRCG